MGVVAPSSLVETTGADLGTTSYTGVIRDADERLAQIEARWKISTGMTDWPLPTQQAARNATGQLIGVDVPWLLAEHAAVAAEVEQLRTQLTEAAGQLANSDAALMLTADEVLACDATIEDLTAEVAMLRRQVVFDLGEIMRLEATNVPDAPSLIGAPCPESCGGQSWTGVDQAEGPGKVWKCDTCGRIVSQSVSNPGRDAPSQTHPWRHARTSEQVQAADDRRAL
jgi:hypothetical protein